MPHPLRTLFLLVLAASQAGCYVMQAARGQWAVMAKREPIARVVARPSTPPAVRTQLEQVLAIREFAVRELKLPDNGSYRSYADVGKPYVVWNVFAAPEFSIEARRWCFPIAGCVAYRGYFDEKRARDFAARLAREGNDVFVGGVAAYSTLGHFDDPVLSTMIGWSDVQLAAVIFHELSHQLLYVAGDSSFNEGFASVIEAEGVKRWLTSAGRTTDLETYRAYQRRHAGFVEEIVGTRARLDELYASGAGAERMRERKQEVFRDLAVAHERWKAQGKGRSPFDRWFADGLNNAHLVSIATYEECVPGIDAVLAATNGDLVQFYARMREIARLDQPARHQRVCARDLETVPQDRRAVRGSGFVAPARK